MYEEEKEKRDHSVGKGERFLENAIADMAGRPKTAD